MFCFDDRVKCHLNRLCTHEVSGSPPVHCRDSICSSFQTTPIVFANRLPMVWSPNQLYRFAKLTTNSSFSNLYYSKYIVYTLTIVSRWLVSARGMYPQRDWFEGNRHIQTHCSTSYTLRSSLSIYILDAWKSPSDWGNMRRVRVGWVGYG